MTNMNQQPNEYAGKNLLRPQCRIYVSYRKWQKITKISAEMQVTETKR